MISWFKSLDMKIYSIAKKDFTNKKVKPKETKIKFLNLSDRFQVPIEIEIDEKTTIVFDAVYLKTACEKCIAIKEI